MDLYLDSADIDEVKRFTGLGSFAGVTTNPVILSRASMTPGQAGRMLLDEQAGAVFLQALGNDSQSLIETGKRFADFDRLRVIIKVPAGEEGIRAMSVLSRNGIRVAATAVFTVGQGLYAFGAGAQIVIPFYGRLSAAGGDAEELVSDLSSLASDYGPDARVVVASLKSPEQVLSAMNSGAHGVTIPPSVAEELLKSDFADTAIKDFNKAAESFGSDLEE